MYVKIIYRCITTSNVEMKKYFYTRYDRYFLVARHNRPLARYQLFSSRDMCVSNLSKIVTQK